jgi:hypothetical protein
VAIKGLVDNQAYVIGDYQTPTGYYSPARSVGDYVLDDFVITDYLLEAQDLVSTFTIQAQGEINAIRATLSVSFTLQAQAEDLDLATGTFSSAFGIDVTVTRILAGSGTLSTQAQQSANANQLVDVTKSITATTTQGTNAIYTADSGTIGITGFYTQTQVAGELFFGEPPDITWDSFAESEFIDRTWDEWYGDAWDQGGVFFSQAITLRALGGYRAQASATLSAEFSQQQAITIIISQEITASATQSVVGNFSASGASSPSAIFTQPAITFDRIRGVAIDGTPLDLPVITQQSASANVRFDLGYVEDLLARFNQATQANALFDTTQEITAQHGQSVDANVTFSITTELEAFNTQISFGRLIQIADPWNTLRVLPETRTLVIPEDSRVIEVLQETRLNTIIAETRGFRVPQETRNFRLYKPVFTDLTTLPRTRSEI